MSELFNEEYEREKLNESLADLDRQTRSREEAMAFLQTRAGRSLTAGGRRLRVDELQKISEYLELPIPRKPLVSGYDPDKINPPP